MPWIKYIEPEATNSLMRVEEMDPSSANPLGSFVATRGAKLDSRLRGNDRVENGEQALARFFSHFRPVRRTNAGVYLH
ncbi:MAG: hypothetical protein ABI790_17055 [Betaproteobacteria bacterium]